MRIRSILRAVLGAAIAVTATIVYAQDSVDEAMDAIVTRLYQDLTLEQLYALDNARVFELITPEERAVFATKHWYFDTNVPVTVSVMRNIEQKVVPFWLEERGFTKTDLRLTNAEGWEYEVWQKEFAAGRVELGVNGFDNFRPHYLVGVAPQEAGAELNLSSFHPANQTVLTLEPGAMTYHDWTELVLEEVPDALRGQKLLTTIRGRGKEAALVGAFRETPFPSSNAPGPVYLTWSDDPTTTQTVQWRTNTEVRDGVVQFWPEGDDNARKEVSAAFESMEDRMLANDRYCHWFSTQIDGLSPATTYGYRVGSPSTGTWSEPATFTTAPADAAPFTFLFCTDTHSNELWGQVMKSTFEKHPEAAFVAISGDLVGTGLEREDWDMFLTYGEEVFRTRPVMPAIGNHDAQLGLGAGMYLDIFGLPENGADGIPKEASYTFTYGNTEFFVLDVMSETAPQSAWLETQLAASDAVWKIAVLHFPIYTHELAYPTLAEGWATLFDKYHVDVALSGHIHRHFRTYPLHGGEIVDSPAEGTVYVTSISIPTRGGSRGPVGLLEAVVPGEYFCNVISVDNNRLEFTSVNPDGEVKDRFVIEK